MNPAIKRLAALRASMKNEHIDAWVVPSADPHLSEYLPEHWQGREWLSGFTGSVPTLVVTEKYAELWADSRYWEQALQQLEGSGIVLQKLGFGRTHIDALAETLPEGATVGVAPDMLSLAAAQQMRAAFATKKIQLRHDIDLLDSIWHDRPTLPQAEIYPHNPSYTPESAAEKLDRVRAAIEEQGATYHLISSLDDIAWITNLRGSDVPYNPVFLSYLLISKKQATLFVEAAKLNTAAQQALVAADISVAPYESITAAISKLDGTLLINPEKTAVSTLQTLSDTVCIIESINPSTRYKACKNDGEIANTRKAMLQDGIALCGFFAELEHRMASGEVLTELDVDTLLLKHRSSRPHFISHSFDTIAGYNANAALPHYRATEEQHRHLVGDGLLLIDSGGQYENGTTDITRVIPIGTPSAAQKRDYTLVLKAHIALAETIFPEDIAAPLLDAICRAPLWQEQCDYGHGTGHGVGYFLNVHEGPQVLSYRAPIHADSGMKVGMITSNEPGLYRPGKWGIRIENLMVNQRVEKPKESEFGTYLYFEALTLCPINTQLVDKTLMNEREVRWLNHYHNLVLEKLAPHTDGDARAWLERNTQPI
ncbi:MAG: aminopeptidase P family protein [Cardiobacteriaceae bacterium]|nr:aminopeptidase P family protein [Cardiobacteriaceae bacterium]